MCVRERKRKHFRFFRYIEDAFALSGRSKEIEKKTKQIKLGFIFLLSVQSQQLALNMYIPVGFSANRQLNNSETREKEWNEMNEEHMKWTASRLNTTGSMRRSSEKRAYKKQKKKNSCSPIFSFPFFMLSRSFKRSYGFVLSAFCLFHPHSSTSSLLQSIIPM